MGDKCDNCWERFTALSIIKTVGGGEIYRVCSPCYAELMQSKYNRLGMAEPSEAYIEALKLLNPLYWWNMLTGVATVIPPLDRVESKKKWEDEPPKPEPEQELPDSIEKPIRKIHWDKL